MSWMMKPPCFQGPRGSHLVIRLTPVLRDLLACTTLLRGEVVDSVAPRTFLLASSSATSTVLRKTQTRLHSSQAACRARLNVSVYRLQQQPNKWGSRWWCWWTATAIFQPSRLRRPHIRLPQSQTFCSMTGVQKPSYMEGSPRSTPLRQPSHQRRWVSTRLMVTASLTTLPCRPMTVTSRQCSTLGCQPLAIPRSPLTRA